jgi:hypothetical protein
MTHSRRELQSGLPVDNLFVAAGVSRRVARRGVRDTDVITTRLMQDERGWLRLAG